MPGILIINSDQKGESTDLEEVIMRYYNKKSNIPKILKHRQPLYFPPPQGGWGVTFRLTIIWKDYVREWE